MRKHLPLVASAIVGSAITLGAYQFMPQRTGVVIRETEKTAPILTSGHGTYEAAPLDFSATAERVTPAVVHIKSTIGAQKSTAATPQIPDAFRDFFGGGANPFFFGEPMQQAPQQSTGSGVIISADGYIVTNNHVIDHADELEVTLHDNRTYKAKVVGTDPSTDLAVIQIKEKDLPTLAFGNSDAVRVGQWVLAVGNPFNLSSTVTAGVVSAKGRNLRIVKDKAAIESFIQTDAAVNPGNSGGALVSLDGGLVGINTAIYSQTGSYAGYAFAVPSKIVEKVTEDLIRYGVVQRGFLGITIRDLNSTLAKEHDLNITEGVLVDSLTKESAAKEGGVKAGDVIVKVDGHDVKNSAQLQEAIGRHRPGDKVALLVNREGKEKELSVTLKNQAGNKEIVKKEKQEVLSSLGVELEQASSKECKKAGIESGVKVSKLLAGKLRQQTDMREGFIITKIDKTPVKSVKDVTDLLNSKTGGVMMEGVYPDYPGTYYYAFGL